jgi:hypothetical protein
MYTSLILLPYSNLTPNLTYIILLGYLTPLAVGTYVTPAGGCQEGLAKFDNFSGF